MKVNLRFEELFVLNNNNGSGYSKNNTSGFPFLDGKPAVYFIKDSNDDVIYIGSTASSVIGRLEKHVSKFLNETPNNATQTKNWRKYRSTFTNHSAELKKWTFGVVRKEEMGGAAPSDFESTLIAAFMVKHRKAPVCNDEYGVAIDDPSIEKVISCL